MDATQRNISEAQAIEADHRKALLEGRRPSRRIQVREFSDATKQFLEWAKVEHREHENTYKRVAASLTSAKEFFGREPRVQSCLCWKSKINARCRVLRLCLRVCWFPSVLFEIIDSRELTKRWCVPESWIRSHTRSRTNDTIPHVRLGRYVHFEWVSPELNEWWRPIAPVRRLAVRV